MTQQGQRPAWILWLALLSAQLVYLGLAASGIGPRDPEFGSNLPVFLPALALVALGTAVVAQLFWRSSAEAPPRVLGAVPDGEGTPVPTSQVVAWVLDESIAVYGLLLAFLGYPAASWTLFNACAFVLFLMHRPRSA